MRQATEPNPLSETEKQAARTLAEFPAVVFATVFGSAAQNRVTPWSDVDVAIAAEKPLDLASRTHLAVALGDRLHREIDLVDLQTAEGLILQQALMGKIVKNDRPDVFAALILKMWYHEADFMPIYRRMMAERAGNFRGNRDAVREKLDSLSRCLARIEEKTPASAQALKRDPDLQNILVLNLQRAVQVCVDLAGHLVAQGGEAPPQTMADTFERLAHSGTITPELALRMKHAVAFRNIAVHAYQNLDWDIVYSILTRHLDDFKAFARTMTEA